MGNRDSSPCIAAFIERAGCLCERDGLPRIAGRILGLLLVSAEPLSLDGIAERLGVSRASVSTDARRLVEQGVLERVGLPGDRKDYYRMASDSPERSLEQKLVGLRQFLALLDEAQRLPGQDPAVSERLAEASALYRDVMLATTDALERWRARPPAVAATQSA
ncbi:MarR family transcriptional regulator [Roseisolibacter sp. H3M3-2]|uniref:GbsR/MarR family transcriptional regulator n=1 Tax=Roseisolibacter sp. H3M3-2 TaxID=3031323 RepID=UPI0023D98E7F|nr:MarR family transcriptional regulator [Roseisolibacter sp. H3M3-2]MDF1504014.1 MarR family transcriptional regulator [Roseisolibacter sp. H3M3-2]